MVSFFIAIFVLEKETIKTIKTTTNMKSISTIIIIAVTIFCSVCATYAYINNMWYELFSTICGYLVMLILCHLFYTTDIDEEDNEEDYFC